MRARWLMLLGIAFCPMVSSAMYKHVDESGTVTYSDRPRQPGQEPLLLPPPNVSTPEARRQLEIARLASEREERAEYEARIRRAVAVQRAAPPARSHTLTPYSPRYALPVYYVGYARIPGQSNPSQGLHPAGVPHRAGNARR